MTVSSPALFPADTITCAFGALSAPGIVSISGAVVPGNAAQLLELLRLSCAAPAAPPSAVQLRVTLQSGSSLSSFDAAFTFYNEQRIVDVEESGGLTIEPSWIDTSGNDDIIIRGESLFSLADTPRLRMTEAAAVEASAPEASAAGVEDAMGDEPVEDFAEPSDDVEDSAAAPSAATAPAAARRLLDSRLPPTFWYRSAGEAWQPVNVLNTVRV